MVQVLWIVGELSRWDSKYLSKETMPHLAGRCDCGREIHFPKNATIGYQWTCHKCGKVWTLSNQGKPLHSQRSKAPPKLKTPSYSSPQKSASGKAPSRSKTPSYSFPQKSKSGSEGTKIGSLLLFVGIIITFLYFYFKK
jgi:hypothetical protein